MLIVTTINVLHYHSSHKNKFKVIQHTTSFAQDTSLFTVHSSQFKHAFLNAWHFQWRLVVQESGDSKVK